ncbi:MAG: ACT domain-containing protein [Chloroflexi bacterium]|nr:ACT domain-containing protein [Chloroflexota bacterium]
MQRIIVSTKNEVGVIAGITAALAERGINIQSLDTEGVGDHGMVVITTDDDDRALLALSAAGYRAVADDALIVRLVDEPGALAQLSAKFRDAGVNIQSMHILNRHGGHATIALSADDLDRARSVVDEDSML